MTEVASRRRIWEEIAIVLALSFLGSLISSIFNIIEQPQIRGTTVALFPQRELTTIQITRIFAFRLLDFAPFFLIVHLGRLQSRMDDFGLRASRLRADIGLGLAGGTGVSVLGAILYFGALAAGLSRQLIAAPPSRFWWGIPMFLFGAAAAGLVEEGVMVAYLIPRLRQAGWGAAWAITASAMFRGGYHLYQGWGGLIGNVLGGLLSGALFVRFRRAWPLIIAHFWIDVIAGFTTLFLEGKCPVGVCF